MKKRNLTPWIGAAGLIGLEQGIKIVINRWFLDASVPLVPPILYFDPLFNRQYSWFNSMLRIPDSKWVHIVLVAALVLALIWLYRRLGKKEVPGKILHVMFAFLFAGAMCSLIDKVFWDGSLDYILLNGFFTFDLKDMYINVFNGLLIYLLLFRNQYLNDIGRRIRGKEGPVKTLIVYAHPNEKSFNHAVFAEVQRGLTDGGHDFSVIELYADGYDPVLVFNENVRRTDLDETTERYQAMIAEADRLIFIYPIWWYGLPAILKGFFDRVLTPGFAYASKNGIPVGLFKDKSAWVIYTIGSPAWYAAFVRGSAEWTVVKNAILGFCGIKCVQKTAFAGMNSSTPARRERQLSRVYRQAKEGL